MIGCGQREDCTFRGPHTHAESGAIYAPLSAMLWPEMDRIMDEYREAIADAVSKSIRIGVDDFLNDPACELSPEDRANVIVAECFRCARVTGFAEKIGEPCTTEGCEGRYIKR